MPRHAVARQSLLVEFSGLKTVCPPGIYMSLVPGEPSLWTGVIFVRKGPYAPAILRFRITFPPDYPTSPPLIIFSTEIFHPLLAPPSTLSYTYDDRKAGRSGTEDDWELPPGGFSLRHGFPFWFRRVENEASSFMECTAQLHAGSSACAVPTNGSSEIMTGVSAYPWQIDVANRRVYVHDILDYIRTTFDDAEILDTIPVEAAADTGAWYAWRTWRSIGSGYEHSAPNLNSLAQTSSANNIEGEHLPTVTQQIGQWNWEGVWRERTKRGIDDSTSESVLYNLRTQKEDTFRFLNLDALELETVRENMKRTLNAA